MDRLERIAAMERALDESACAVGQLVKAIDRYKSALPALNALSAYYTGPDWLSDVDADARGELPKTLKRGVLSEDAVFDLLETNGTLPGLLRELLNEAETK